MKANKIRLPHIGNVYIMQDPKRAGHYLYLSSFGWHDCVPVEDKLITLSL